MNLLVFFIIIIGFIILKASGSTEESAMTAMYSQSNVDIDEEAPIENYIKARDILNSVDFNGITKSELNKLIDELAEIDNSEFDENLKNVDFKLLKESLIEARDILNSKDLDSRTTMTTREFYQGFLTDEQMEEAQIKVNQALNSEVEDREFVGFENKINDNPSSFAFFDNKEKRIKKKRKLLEELEREHGFQRGYLPYWDSEEHLYDKYKGDEEKYLDAKILELRSKNISHDTYLSESEKEIYDDDADGGMW